MEERVVPTLTKRGWIRPVSERADYILAYLFETLPSENWLVQKETKSVQSLIAEYTNDTDGFIVALRNLIDDRFKLYFDDVSVDVNYAPGSEHNLTGRADLVVNIMLTENNEVIKLEREFRGEKGVFKMVVKQINYGE